MIARTVMIDTGDQAGREESKEERKQVAQPAASTFSGEFTTPIPEPLLEDDFYLEYQDKVRDLIRLKEAGDIDRFESTR